jgi:hypothetical protein
VHQPHHTREDLKYRLTILHLALYDWVCERDGKTMEEVKQERKGSGVYESWLREALGDEAPWLS